MSQKSYTVSLDMFLIRNTLLFPLWLELPFILLFISLSGVTCWRLLTNNSQAKYLKIPRSAHVSCLLWSKRWDRAGICIIRQNGQEPGGGVFWYSHKQNSSQLLIRISINSKPRIKEIAPDIVTFFRPFFLGVARWRSCLRPCAKSRKFAGLISVEVTEIFYWINPSGHSMVLESTHPLKEINTSVVSWRVQSAGAYGWQLYHFHVPIV